MRAITVEGLTKRFGSPSLAVFAGWAAAATLAAMVVLRRRDVT